MAQTPANGKERSRARDSPIRLRLNAGRLTEVQAGLNAALRAAMRLAFSSSGAALSANLRWAAPGSALNSGNERQSARRTAAHLAADRRPTPRVPPDDSAVRAATR